MEHTTCTYTKLSSGCSTHILFLSFDCILNFHNQGKRSTAVPVFTKKAYGRLQVQLH